MRNTSSLQAGFINRFMLSALHLRLDCFHPHRPEFKILFAELAAGLMIVFDWDQPWRKHWVIETVLIKFALSHNECKCLGQFN